jgi:hypothetical protein
VTALFTNNVTLNGQTGGPGPAKIHPSKGLWSISKGISTGHAGKKVASGQGTASFKPTGRDFKNANGDHFEYTLLVKLAGFYFKSNSTSRTNKFGPVQPKAMDFANAPAQGLNFTNVCTEQGATPASCAYQSAGVVGTQK